MSFEGAHPPPSRGWKRAAWAVVRATGGGGCHVEDLWHVLRSEWPNCSLRDLHTHLQKRTDLYEWMPEGYVRLLEVSVRQARAVELAHQKDDGEEG